MTILDAKSNHLATSKDRCNWTQFSGESLKGVWAPALSHWRRCFGRYFAMIVENDCAVESHLIEPTNVHKLPVVVTKGCESLFDRYSKPATLLANSIQYGTAGFRLEATLMHFIAFRMGVLAALLAKKRHKNVGVMITASHNPEQDNGIKIVEPNGEMLAKTWEEYATDFVNCKNDAVQFNCLIQNIIDAEVIDEAAYATVIVGCDTRSSSLELCNALSNGVKYVQNVMLIDYGFVTTPELHFFVGESNRSAFGHANEEKYFNRICGSFKDFIEYCCINKNTENSSASLAVENAPAAVTRIFVDCANGVGGGKMQKIANYFSQSSTYIIDPFNVGTDAENKECGLNHECGADYVKIAQLPPNGCPRPSQSNANLLNNCRTHFCSIDGDADRLVYFYFHESKFCLLDGDKIAALFCFYLNRLFAESSIQCAIGVVQTAYANGASTAYFQETLKIKTECVVTGVKNLHEAAKEYDIGIYFEANGHGTILIKKEFQHFLEKKFLHCPPSSREKRTITKILLFLKIVNNYVGDAISDMFVVEAILYDTGLSLADWDAFYADRPSKQTKLRIANKNAFKTADADRRLTAPLELQDFVDQTLVLHGPDARCFIRPSGTEDILRIYAEAPTVASCDAISAAVAEFIAKNFS